MKDARLVLSWVVFLITGTAFAQPEIDRIEPLGGRLAAGGEMQIHGENLEGQTIRALTHQPDFRVTGLRPSSNGSSLSGRFSAPSELTHGQVSFQLVGPTSFSKVAVFDISPYTRIFEREPQSIDNNPGIQINRTMMEGVITPGDEDFFHVDLIRGDRFGFEVVGARLGHAFWDPFVSIYGPTGTILMEVDDTVQFGLDPAGVFRAPSSGRYTVAIRDSVYGGDENAGYCIYFGDFPGPGVRFPIGPLGESTNVVWRDALGESRFLGGQQPPPGLPNMDIPRPIKVWPWDEGYQRLESQPFPENESAPFSIDGELSTPGEKDHYAWRPKRPQQVDIAIVSRRMGAPLDATLTIYDENGAILSSNDDFDGVDSRVRLTVDAQQLVTIEVADQRGRGGPLFVYRLEVTPVAPNWDFAFDIPGRSPDAPGAVIPQGGRVGGIVTVRRDGFSGPVSIAPDRLPPGVTFDVGRIDESTTRAPFVFEATTEAPLAALMVGFQGKASDRETSIPGKLRQPVALLRGPPQDAVYESMTLEQWPLAVTQPSPFSVSIDAPPPPLFRDGEIDLEINVQRATGFTDPVTLSVDWAPTGLHPPEDIPAPEGRDTVTLPIGATRWAELGPRQFFVTAAAKVDGLDWVVSSPLVTVEIIEAIATLSFEPAILVPGTESTWEATLDWSPSAAETVGGLLEIVGLEAVGPATPVTITRASRTITWRVQTPADAEPSLGVPYRARLTLDQQGGVQRQYLGMRAVARVGDPSRDDTLSEESALDRLRKQRAATPDLIR